MATRGPKLVCEACGEDVRLYSLVENDGMVIGCACEDVRHSEDAMAYEMGVQHTSDDWRVACDFRDSTDVPSADDISIPSSVDDNPRGANDDK